MFNIQVKGTLQSFISKFKFPYHTVILKILSCKRYLFNINVDLIDVSKNYMPLFGECVKLRLMLCYKHDFYTTNCCDLVSNQEARDTIYLHKA